MRIGDTWNKILDISMKNETINETPFPFVNPQFI